MAGIEVPRIIKEPTAAALAYGLGYNLEFEDPSKEVKKTTAKKASTKKTTKSKETK